MTDDNLTKGQCCVLAHFLLEYRVPLDVEMITIFPQTLSAKPEAKNQNSTFHIRNTVSNRDSLFTHANQNTLMTILNFPLLCQITHL